MPAEAVSDTPSTSTADDSPVDTRQRDSRLGASREDLVEVECLPERFDDACPPPVLVHLVDRVSELARESVHPLAHLHEPTGEASVRHAASAKHHRGDDDRWQRVPLQR